MQTSTLVQASADVVRIVTLRQFDVYKRLEKNWQDQYAMWLGVVQSVDYNGEDALVTALELNPSTGKTELKHFGTGTDLKLFPATPQEIQHGINEVLQISDRNIKAAEDALEKEKTARRALESAINQVGNARVPEVTDAVAPALIEG